VKLRFMVIALVLASVAVSAAVAAPPPGKGKPEGVGKPETAGQGKPATTGAACKPKVSVVLKGMLASASTTSLGVEVTHTNRWGRAYDEATAAVAVDETTKVRRNGKKTLADLVVRDRVLVQARACKADLKDEATPALTAWKVVAHPAKVESGEDDD
jgi:hypothetical protein